MRRMFSKNQIETLAKEVADYEIKNAEINVSQLKAHEDYQGQYLQVQNDGSVIPAGTGGTKLYTHHFTNGEHEIVIINNSPTAITLIDNLSIMVGSDGVIQIFIYIDSIIENVLTSYVFFDDGGTTTLELNWANSDGTTSNLSDVDWTGVLDDVSAL